MLRRRQGCHPSPSYLRSSLFTQQSLHQTPPFPSIAEPHDLQSGALGGCAPPPGTAVPSMGLRSPVGGGVGATCPSPGLGSVTKMASPKRSCRAVTYIHPHKGSRPSVPLMPVPVPSARRRGHRAACLERWRPHGTAPRAHGRPPAFEHPACIPPPPSLRGACWRTGGSPFCRQGDAGGARLCAAAGPVWEPWGTSPACQVRPAHAERGMGTSMSRCSKAWRNKQRGIFFVCIGCSLTPVCAWAAPCRELTAFLLSESKSCPAKRLLKKKTKPEN